MKNGERIIPRAPRFILHFICIDLVDRSLSSHFLAVSDVVLALLATGAEYEEIDAVGVGAPL